LHPQWQAHTLEAGPGAIARGGATAHGETMDSIFSSAPQLIAEAAKSRLGLAGLMVLLLAALGFVFFRRASEKVRVGIFLALLVGASSFVIAVLRQEDAGSADIGRRTVPPAGNGEVVAYFRSLPQWGKFSPAAPEKHEPVGPPKGGAGGACTTTAYSITETPREIVTFDPDSEILWPGALLQGRYHARLAGLQELPVRQRGALTLSLDLLTKENTRTVVNPALASVQSAIGELVEVAARAGHRAGSDISYDQVSSHSLEQTALELGLSARHLGSNVRGRLRIGDRAQQQSITAYFVQRMFTVSVELPQTPAEVFGSGFSRAALQEQADLDRIGPDNPPIYVSNVVFGRMLLFTFTSSASAEDIQGALQFAYQGAATGVSAEAKTRYQKVLGSAQIQVVTVGGSADDALALIRSAGLRDYFRSDAPLTAARPISYTLRSLADNAIAAVSETTKYEVTECEPPPPPRPRKGHNFVVTLSDIDDDAYAYVNGKRIVRQDRKKSPKVSFALDPHLGSGNNRLRVRLGNYGCFAWKLSMTVAVDGDVLIRRGDEGNAGPWPVGCGWQLDWCYTVNRETGKVTESNLKGDRCK
jgi:hypothetical protein